MLRLERQCVVDTVLVHLITQPDRLVAPFHDVLAILEATLKHPQEQLHLGAWCLHHAVNETLLALELKIEGDHGLLGFVASAGEIHLFHVTQVVAQTVERYSLFLKAVNH